MGETAPKLTCEDFAALEANLPNLVKIINTHIAETNSYEIKGLVEQIQVHRRNLVDLEKGEMIDSVIIPLLTRLENKTFDDNSLKLKAIKRKLDKNKEQIKMIFLDEIKRHVLKAEKIGKSDVIPPSPYKDLIQKAPAYIINTMLAEIDIEI